MRVRVLGPLEVDDLQQRPLPLGVPKQRTLLALLLVRAGTVVPDGTLIDELWGDQPPASALTNLRAYAAALRRVLDGATGAPVLTKSGSGYLLTVAGDEFDLPHWRQETQAGQQALADGSMKVAADHFQEGLRLWRGPALANVPLGLALASWRDTVHEQRMDTAESLIEALLHLGHLGAAIEQSCGLLAEAPMRERTAGLLMRARYQTGDIAGALAVYEQLRRVLVEALGVEPSEELRGIQTDVLRRTLQPVPSSQPVSPMVRHPREAPTTPRQLPPDVAGFAGRVGALASLDGLLSGLDSLTATVVISAIAGTAGVGKTALAVHWAHRVADRFPDGQLYVNLRGFDPSAAAMSPSEAARGLLEALNVAPQRIPETLDAQVGLYRSLLDGRKMLIVLDNARDADQVRPLLPGTSGCLTVVTSRSQLSGLVAIDGAYPLMVDLLTTDEAHDMLVRRLGHQRVAAEPDATKEIIDLCAHLPMALAIVAARAVTHPGFRLRDLAAQLQQARGRLDAFDNGDPVTNMRVVFSWSYRTLGQPAADLFRRLGLHPGLDITVPAAASLTGRPVRDVRPALLELAHAYLLTEHTPDRYTCHDLLRAYAAELAGQTDPGPSRQETTQRILDHYLHTAYTADRLLRPDREQIRLAPAAPGVTPQIPQGQQDAVAWFAAEHPVLLAAVGHAVRHGFDGHAWQLAWSLEDFYDWRGHWHELAAAQRTALEAAQRHGDLIGQAHTHRGLARAQLRTGNHQQALTHLNEAIDLFTRIRDPAGQAATHRNLAIILSRLGRHQDALKHDQIALDLHRAGDDLTGQALVLNNLGYHYAMTGQYRDALAHCRQALALHQKIAARDGEARTWGSLGYAYSHLDQHSEAIAAYRRAIDLFSGFDRTSTAESLDRLAQAYQRAGETTMAYRTWQQALELFDELGHPEAAHVRARLARHTPPPH